MTLVGNFVSLVCLSYVSGELPTGYFRMYTWIHSDNFYGALLSKYNYYGDISVGVLLIVINLGSVVFYFKMRNKVSQIV